MENRIIGILYGLAAICIVLNRAPNIPWFIGIIGWGILLAGSVMSLVLLWRKRKDKKL